MKKTIEITYQVQWTETVTVDLEEPVYERAAERVLEAAMEAHDPEPPPNEFIDYVDHRWIGGEPEYTFEPATWPSDKCAIEVDGHRWVTDGTCLLREDSAMPSHICMGWSWRDDVTPEQVRAVMGQISEQQAVMPPRRRTYNRRFALVLAQGSTVERKDQATTVIVDGEIVAYVQPMTRDGHIYADGTEVPRG